MANRGYQHDYQVLGYVDRPDFWRSNLRLPEGTNVI